MQLLSSIKKFAGILHGVSIKMGHVKEKIFFENLKTGLCQKDYIIIKNYPILIDLKDRKTHRIDVFVQNKRKKIIYCLNIKGKATNFNIPASTVEPFLQRVITNMKNKFIGYTVEYIFVKEDFYSDFFFDEVKSFNNVKVINYVDFTQLFAVNFPTDSQVEKEYFKILREDLIKNDFNLEIILKIFSKVLN